VQIVFCEVSSPAGSRGVSLGSPTPNPASTVTRLALTLPGPGAARVEVFDLGGRRVCSIADGQFSGTPTDVRWNLADESGRRVPAGLYFVRATAGQGTVTRRLVVIK